MAMLQPQIQFSLLEHNVRLQDYGKQERSGKLVVLARVLKHWHAQGHK